MNRWYWHRILGTKLPKISVREYNEQLKQFFFRFFFTIKPLAVVITNERCKMSGGLTTPLNRCVLPVWRCKNLKSKKKISHILSGSCGQTSTRLLIFILDSNTDSITPSIMNPLPTPIHTIFIRSLFASLFFLHPQIFYVEVYNQLAREEMIFWWIDASRFCLRHTDWWVNFNFNFFIYTPFGLSSSWHLMIAHHPMQKKNLSCKKD